VRDGRRPRRYTVYRDDETFELQMRDRRGVVALRRAPGNAAR